MTSRLIAIATALRTLTSEKFLLEPLKVKWRKSGPAADRTAAPVTPTARL